MSNRESKALALSLTIFLLLFIFCYVGMLILEIRHITVYIGLVISIIAFCKSLYDFIKLTIKIKNQEKLKE